jgi:hypothetical protein
MFLAGPSTFTAELDINDDGLCEIGVSLSSEQKHTLAWIPMDPFRVNKSVCSRSEIPEDFRVFLDKAWYRLTRMMDTRITPSGETPNEC